MPLSKRSALLTLAIVAVVVVAVGGIAARSSTAQLGWFFDLFRQPQANQQLPPPGQRACEDMGAQPGNVPNSCNPGWCPDDDIAGQQECKTFGTRCECRPITASQCQTRDSDCSLGSLCGPGTLCQSITGENGTMGCGCVAVISMPCIQMHPDQCPYATSDSCPEGLVCGFIPGDGTDDDPPGCTCGVPAPGPPEPPEPCGLVDPQNNQQACGGECENDGVCTMVFNLDTNKPMCTCPEPPPNPPAPPPPPVVPDQHI